MTTLNQLQSNEEWKQAMEKSVKNPVILFKHSSTCPISANAYSELNTFSESAKETIDYYFVVVSENRDISNQIAEETKIKHESPQIFLISNKEVIWHTSHSNITKESILEALKKAK